MKSQSKSRKADPRRCSVAMQTSPIAAAVSTLLLSVGTAHAQQAPTTQASDGSQSIVVTGIRRAIETSIATKRNSDSIVEAISAEDIGKLPDVSIAESLARVPGLAGQRVGGRVQAIQIRGLSSDFAGTTLNGRQQVTTGDNRSVEFDQFPSELINGATIYKTPDAGLLGQGLSGTIDMQTIRPLDLRGRKVSLNARREANSQGELNAGTDANGNRFSLSYIDQFANNTVGVALGYAHLDSPGQELHYKAWGFGKLNADCTAHPEWGCSQATGVPAGATVQNGFEATALSRLQKRDGLMAVLEYKPSKDLHSTVDLYYSKFKKDETMRGLMNGLAEGWSGNPGVAYSNVKTTTIGSTTLVTSADLANTNFIVRNDKNTRDDKLKSLGWNLKAKLGDTWTGVGDLSYSSAERDENVIETYAGARRVNPTPPPATLQTYGTTGISIDPSSSFPRFTPGLNYADASTIYLSDPAHDWGHDGLWKLPHAKDVIKSGRFDLRRDMDGFLSHVNLGFDYTTRQKDRRMNELQANLKSGRAPTLVPGSLIESPTSLAFVGIPGVLSYNVMGALAQLYDLTPQAIDQIINRNYDVKEKVGTAYAKLNFEGKVGSVPVRGNFGLQFVHTDQSSTGFAKQPGDIATHPVQQVTRGTKYSDVLPSFNMVFELPSDSYVRFGVAETMARGRMDDMRAGGEVSFNPTAATKWSGSAGNPELQPWRATSLDLSFEKYFGKRSYLAAAVWYKDLESYIYTQQIPTDFAAYQSLYPASANQSTQGLLNTPSNGQGGHIWGVEYSASMEAGVWVPALDGFGVTANVSHTLNDLEPNGPGTGKVLPGLSGITAGLTAYYEKYGFSARISNRYRSAYRGEITGLHNARTFSNILADRQTDLQLGYEFNSGALKGLSVLLQVNNLTNSPYATRQGNGLTGDVIAPEEYNKYGRQTLLGINYKL